MSMDSTLNTRDAAIASKLRTAALLTAVIFVFELAGGFLTSSLALLSDAMHVFMDLFALSLSLFALYISAMAPTSKRTFGLHRGEVLAALINGLSLLIISIIIFYKAWTRLSTPVEVHGTGMFWVALIGLSVNLLVAYWLMDSQKTDLNVRSAFLHVVGDLIASLGVIMAAVIIHYTGFMLIDPIISFFIGAILVYGSLRVIRDSVHILLEGVPGSIDLEDVVEHMKEIDGVRGVHSIHFWSICHNVYALSAHIDTNEECGISGRQEIVCRINDLLKSKYNVKYTTLQLDCESCSKELYRAIEHSADDGAHHHHSH